jgi:hypothetical protein
VIALTKVAAAVSGLWRAGYERQLAREGVLREVEVESGRG